MYISVAEAHRHLSRWLNKVRDHPVTITRRASSSHPTNMGAYLQMLRISRSLNEGESGIAAKEIFRALREELEERS